MLLLEQYKCSFSGNYSFFETQYIYVALGYVFGEKTVNVHSVGITAFLKRSFCKLPWEHIYQ